MTILATYPTEIFILASSVFVRNLLGIRDPRYLIALYVRDFMRNLMAISNPRYLFGDWDYRVQL